MNSETLGHIGAVLRSAGPNQVTKNALRVALDFLGGPFLK